MKDVARDEESPKLEASNEGNYQPKRKRPYQNLGTDLTLEDMTNPGVHKLLLAENSRLETENYEYKVECDGHGKIVIEHAQRGVELEHLKKSNKFVDTLYSAGLGAGTCLAGIAISIEPLGLQIAVAFIGIGVAGIAVVARVKRNED